MTPKTNQLNTILTVGELKQLADATQKIAFSAATLAIALTCLAFSICPIPTVYS